MKAKHTIILLLLGTVSIFSLLLSFLKINAVMKFNRSISIIGGADGPTSILVTDRSQIPIYIITVVLIVLTLILLFIFKRKK